MSTERYNFQTTVQKIVFPSSSFSVKCYYNSTLLTANLYTKKAKDSNLPSRLRLRSRSEILNFYPNTDSPEQDWLEKRQQQSSPWTDWPYASDISQSVGGGQGVPDCYQYDSSKPDQVGTRITDGYTPKGAGDFCSCGWSNFGLSS